ncbi:MAG TPA: FAD-dependent oxidoreductase [Spirochaetia bacterium]|nr:FAD-dependent oxidoreductase [Spirochaetia bacterium]
MNSRGFYPITLKEKIQEYDQVFTLRFVPEEPIDFVPGQYVHLLAPASPPGPENVRHLSLASTPEEGFLQFTVDLAPTSTYKTRLAALEPGGQAHLFKVKGEFVWGDPPPSQAIFWAGGLGITPVRSLVRSLVATKLSVDWALVHVARGAWLYQKEFEPWGGNQVRIRREGLATEIAPRTGQWPGARHYVSGSARFVTAVTQMLTDAGVPEARVVVENFR